MREYVICIQSFYEHGVAKTRHHIIFLFELLALKETGFTLYISGSFVTWWQMNKLELWCHSKTHNMSGEKKKHWSVWEKGGWHSNYIHGQNLASMNTKCKQNTKIKNGAVVKRKDDQWLKRNLNESKRNRHFPKEYFYVILKDNKWHLNVILL